jgi:fermentation-respiration switch protein FrsA (DUF1100 family)
MFAAKASRPASRCRPLLCSTHLHRELHPRPACVKRPTALAESNYTCTYRQTSFTSAQNHHQHRSFLTSLPTALVPPVVFAGLLLALWTYKVVMTVVFQEKILYMSYMPPQTRSEKIEDYAATCKPVQWEEVRIKSLDGTRIALGVGMIPPPASRVPTKEVVILYFMGNGGSLPPRLPLLANTLKLIHSRAGDQVRFTMVALSYRGYWTSSGRATEPGIKLDAQATLQWVKFNHPNASVVLWGQSLGAGVACAAAERHLSVDDSQLLQGLILETPFTSVSSMLLALYPEKWLPYRYLSTFLRSHWDSTVALQRIASTKVSTLPQVLLIAATRDEIVPSEEAEKLQKVCEEASLGFRRVNVIGALHNEATMRREGQEAIAKFVVGQCGAEKVL